MSMEQFVRLKVFVPESEKEGEKLQAESISAPVAAAMKTGTGMS